MAGSKAAIALLVAGICVGLVLSYYLPLGGGRVTTFTYYAFSTRTLVKTSVRTVTRTLTSTVTVLYTSVTTSLTTVFRTLTKTIPRIVTSVVTSTVTKLVERIATVTKSFYKTVTRIVTSVVTHFETTTTTVYRTRVLSYTTTVWVRSPLRSGYGVIYNVSYTAPVFLFNGECRLYPLYASSGDRLSIIIGGSGYGFLYLVYVNVTSGVVPVYNRSFTSVFRGVVEVPYTGWYILGVCGSKGYGFAQLVVLRLKPIATTVATYTRTTTTTSIPPSTGLLSPSLTAPQVDAIVSSWRLPRVLVGNGYLWVYLPGLISFIYIGGSSGSLTIYGEKLPFTVGMAADRVYASLNYTLIGVSVKRIVSKLPPGSYRLEVYSQPAPGTGSSVLVEACSLRIEGGGGISVSGCRLIHRPYTDWCSRVSSSSVSSDYDLGRLCYYTSNVLWQVSKLVYGSSAPSSVSSAVWTALAWVGAHISYDYSRASPGVVGTLSPLETIERGKGVCRDYAVLLAAILLSARVMPAAILEFPSIMHAAAGAYVNGSLVILDQHLPPVEPGDYEDYIVGKRIGLFKLSLYWLKGGRPLVEIINAAKFNATDTWPSDSWPPGFNTTVSQYTAEDIGGSSAKQLETLIRLNATGYAYEELYAGTLGGVRSKRPPLSKLYSPLFSVEWAKYLASIASSLVEKYFPGSHYVWVSLTSDRIYVAASSEFVSVTTTLSKPDYIITLGASVSPSEASIIVYNASNRKPVLGITAQGYSYPNLKTIQAIWQQSTRQTIVVVDYDTLIRELKSMGVSRGILVVFYRGSPVYATLIVVS